MQRSELLDDLTNIKNKEDLTEFLKKLNLTIEELDNDADYLGLNVRKLGDKDLKDISGGTLSFKSNKNALIFTGALFCSLGGGCVLGKYTNRPSEYDRRMKNIGNLFNNYLKNNVMDDKEYNNMCQMLNTTPEDYLTMKS